MELEFEIKRAIEGSKDSFSNLVRHYELSLYKVARSILQSDDDCADAIQEAILKAYKSIGTLREVKFFKTWLIRILINECRNINKAKVKIIPIHELENMLCEQQMTANIHDDMEMQEILNCIEYDLRTVVALYYFEEFSVKEISSILDIPEGTVKSRLSRARLKLKDIFKENIEGRECCGR